MELVVREVFLAASHETRMTGGQWSLYPRLGPGTTLLDPEPGGYTWEISDFYARKRKAQEPAFKFCPHRAPPGHP